MKKTAMITGAGRGIGRAIARRLGADGYQLVLVARSPKEAYQDLLTELEEAGTACLYISADISSAQDRIRILQQTIDQFHEIHVLVNNAGIAPLERKDLLEMTEASYDRVMQVNTKAPLFLTQLVARQMIQQPVRGKKRGTIVNISSCSAQCSSISRGEYCISKAGVSMLTTLFADRLAPEGILVHEVRPGVIATDMTAAVQDKYDHLIQNGVFPIRRWGQPEDVANAVSAFCSDDFLYTTGNYIDIDGGFHIKRL